MAKEQSRQEFERFVSTSAGDLLRTAYLVVWDLPAAEDLVQECFLRVARRWPRVRAMKYPTAYARKVLFNLALDGAKRQGRERSELDAGSQAPPAQMDQGLPSQHQAKAGGAWTEIVSVSSELEGPGGVEHAAMAHLRSGKNGPYTMIEGAAASYVTALTLVRSNGEDVEATVGGGMFVAWWPGPAGAVSADVTTAEGTTSGPLMWQSGAPGAPVARSCVVEGRQGKGRSETV